MPNNKSRQQKLMKKRQKQKTKKKQAAQQHITSPERTLARRAASMPLLECLINANAEDNGMALIVVARMQNEHLVLIAVYVVDTFCLGIKNTYYLTGMPLTDYRADFRTRFVNENDAVPCTIQRAHQLIYGAVDYARAMGFRPHKAFSMTRHIIGATDAHPRDESLAFGKDGKPLYISGPDDKPKQIVKQLEKRLGPDGFHFVLNVNP